MTARVLVAAVGLSIATMAPVVAQQPRATGTATAITGTAEIAGVVSTPAEGAAERPLRRVVIRLLSSNGQGMRETVTDDLGRFVFAELPAGRFTIAAVRAGYLTMTYGAKRTKGTGTTISLAAGQRVSDLRISMPRGAVVTGTITDSFGKPIPNALVELFERVIFNGTTALTRAGGTVTDDRGVYRVFGLAPGTFIVSVTGVDDLSNPARQTTAAEVQWAMQPRTPGNAAVAPPANPTRSLATVYYPGTIDLRAAAPLVLAAGQERAGVDFAIQFVAAVRVSGTLTRPDGRPAAGISLVLQPESPSGFEVAVSPRLARRGTTVGANGEFTFDSVQPGGYAISAQLGTQGGEFWLREHVEVVAEDLAGLAFAMRTGFGVTGRVAIAPGIAAVPPAFTTLRVELRSAQAGTAFRATNAAADGTFSLTAAMPGPYSLTAALLQPGPSTGGSPWAVKSIAVGGRDVMDRTFESSSGQNIDDVVVTLTDRISSLAGRLIDGDGRPALDYFVVLIPEDRAFWQQRLSRSPKSLRPGNDGAFRFTGVPPGDYYIVAAEDIDNTLLFRADYLEQLIPAAIKLTIAEGEKKVQDLKIVK